MKHIRNHSEDNVLNSDPGKVTNLFCYDLPSEPQPLIGKVLVTGASGYIGGRLVPELLARGYRVRVMVRDNSDEYQLQWPKAKVVTADALNLNSLKKAMKDIDVAYYLIHSLILGIKYFESAEIQAANNFRIAAEENNIKRIIYLGGLGDIHADLSSHLRSRFRVGEELNRGKVPVTILRAAIVIGSGSASYEIVEHLVRSLPVLFVPLWARNKCQPIGIRDVIKYLVGVLEISETSGQHLDIGGDDILTYHKMLKIFAGLYKLKRIFIPIPFSHIGIYSYITSFLTPVPEPIIHCLIEGLKNEVVCENNSIKQYLPFKNLPYREAIVRAVNLEDQDKILTRWSDAYHPSHERVVKLNELRHRPEFTTAYSLFTKKNASSMFQSICKIGGKDGWFSNNWMWRLRGLIDRILLGVGTARGRRSQSSLRINDVIGFWRIEDLQLNERLLLRAEMKLPGKAWLEFTIHDEGVRRKLSAIPYYTTFSLLGKIYWYIFLPFHEFLFNNLIKQIEQRS